jgi:hypothetical protein
MRTVLCEGGMKRLLIFTALFPPIALVVFNAPDMIAGNFRLMDFTSLQTAYILAIVPAWLLAAISWRLQTVAGTTIAGAVLACLAGFVIGFPDFGAMLMLGLVGAIPAAVCSWLSSASAA